MKRASKKSGVKTMAANCMSYTKPLKGDVPTKVFKGKK